MKTASAAALTMVRRLIADEDVAEEYKGKREALLLGLAFADTGLLESAVVKLSFRVDSSGEF
jgi:hypothetical protein